MQARRLPASRGRYWIVEGFRLFRRNPPLMSTVTLTYLVLVLAMNFLPLIGPFLLPLALPVFSVCVANAARSIERGAEFRPAALFEGIFENRKALFVLGCLQLAGSLALLGLTLLVEGGRLVSLDTMNGADEIEVLGALLRMMLLALPLVMAFWFSPLLTAWDGVPAAKALFFSFVASWRNWRAFLVYGIGLGLLMVFAPGLLLIVFGLVSKTLLDIMSIALRMMLVFVFAPVLMASAYVSYRDVFGPEPDHADAG